MEHEEVLKEIGESSAAIREFAAPLSIHADVRSRTFSKYGANFLFHFDPSS